MIFSGWTSNYRTMPCPLREGVVKIIHDFLNIFFLTRCLYLSVLSKYICFASEPVLQSRIDALQGPGGVSGASRQIIIMFSSKIWRSCFLWLGLASRSCLPLPGTREIVMCLCKVGYPKRKPLFGVFQCWRNYTYCSGSPQTAPEPCLFPHTFKMTTALVRHYLNSRQLWKCLARKHVGDDNRAIANFGCHKAECLKILPRKSWRENVTRGAPDYFLWDINIFAGNDYRFTCATGSALNQYKGKNKLSCPALITVKKHALFPRVKVVELSTLRNITPTI